MLTRPSRSGVRVARSADGGTGPRGAGDALRVDFVHLEFGTEQRDASLRFLARTAARMGAARCRLVVVDNAGAAATVQPPPGIFDEAVVLLGDNRHREFSGWDVGSAWLSRQPGEPADVVVFSNDTMLKHHALGMGRERRFATTFVRSAIDPRPVICGEVVRLSGVPALPWGRPSAFVVTYLFALNASAFRALAPFCAIEGDVWAMLAPTADGGRLFSTSAPAAYAGYVERWMTTPGRWYRAAAVTADNFEFMRLKAASILFEHSLSARIAAAGGRVRSIYAGDTPLDRAAGALWQLYERRLRLPALRKRAWAVLRPTGMRGPEGRRAGAPGRPGRPRAPDA